MSNAQKNQSNKNQQTYEDNDLLIAIYGKDSFLKVYQALEIGKIKFSFVKKEDPKNSIDCFMNADDFVSDLIDLIDTRTLEKKAAYEKEVARQKNAKYAENIWESKAGISAHDENAKIRKFSIQPGTAQEIVFRASQGEKSIIVGGAFRDLKLLSYRWHYLENDWNAIMASKYSLEKMKNSYREKENQKQYEAQMKEAEEGDLPVPQNEPAKPANKPAESNDYGVTTEELTTVEDDLPVSNVEEPKPEPTPATEEKAAPKAPAGTSGSAHSTSQNLPTISVKVKNALTPMTKGGYAFQAWNEQNKILNVVIRADQVSQLTDEIKKLMEESSKIGNKVTLRVAGENKEKNIIFVA